LLLFEEFELTKLQNLLNTICHFVNRCTSTGCGAQRVIFCGIWSL